jgi:hypothetical protein
LEKKKKIKCKFCLEKDFVWIPNDPNIKTAVYNKDPRKYELTNKNIFDSNKSNRVKEQCKCAILQNETKSILKDFTKMTFDDLPLNYDREIEYWQRNYRDGFFVIPLYQPPIVTNIHRGYVPNLKVLPQAFLYLHLRNLFLEDLQELTTEFQFLYDYRDQFGRVDLDLRQFEIPPEHVYKDDFGQKLSFYKKFKEELQLKKKETEDMMNTMRADLDYIGDYLECEKAFIDDAKARQAREIAEELDKLRGLLDDHRNDVIRPIKRQIRLLERQLNKLGRVQEKLAVFSKIIKRKGILLRVRSLFDIFSANDLRLKVKVFDDKNNVVDDFGNICVFKTRRLENHVKRYHILNEFMDKLKSKGSRIKLIKRNL